MKKEKEKQKKMKMMKEQGKYIKGRLKARLMGPLQTIWVHCLFFRFALV